MISEARWRPDAVEILVSDNSPDVTEAVARPLIESYAGDGRYLANRPNIGMVANFNRCIAESRGDALLILHDDDYLLPGAVEAILAGLRRAPPDHAVLLFGVQIVTATGAVVRSQVPDVEEHLRPRRAMVNLLGNSSFARFPGVVVRREGYARLGGFREGLLGADDFDMWIRLFSAFGARLVPAEISAYSIHLGAATSGMFNRPTVDALLGLFDEARASGILDAATIRECQARWFHQFILSGVYRALRAGDDQSAREVFGLLDTPAIADLGTPVRWLPVRLAFRWLLGLPPRLIRPLIQLGGRLNLQHRLRYIA